MNESTLTELDATSIADCLPEGFFDVRAWTTRRPSRTIVSASKMVAGRPAYIEVESPGALTQELLDDSFVWVASLVKRHMAAFEQEHEPEAVK